MLSLSKHPAVRRIFAFHFRYARSFDKLRMTRENANLPYKTKAPHFCGALYYLN